MISLYDIITDWSTAPPQIQHPYGTWLPEHEGTITISANAAVGADPNAVNLTIESVDQTSGGGESSWQYNGTWTLVRQDGRLYMDSVALRKT